MDRPALRLFAIIALLGAPAAAAQPAPPPPATLGLDGPYTSFDAGGFRLDVLDASQTATALVPLGSEPFDFTPVDRLTQRAADRNYQLGDLTLRWRPADSMAWRHASTAHARRPVRALDDPEALSAADLGATLPGELPLRVVRRWTVRNGSLALEFDLSNTGSEAVEIGALGIPMVFNNILTGRSLEEAHAAASFQDPYIGLDAGYVQVTRLSGEGPVLLVLPLENSPLEAWNPLLDEGMRRGITFEGFYEWMVHTRAFAENEWATAAPWNAPTSVRLEPGASRTYGVRFVLADSIRGIEDALRREGRPVVVGVPGFVLPTDTEGRLFVRHTAPVVAVDVEPAGSVTLEPGAPLLDPAAHPIDAAATVPDPGAPLPDRTARPPAPTLAAYSVRGHAWGRSRVTLTYADGLRQTVHYKVIDPAVEVVDAVGRFLFSEQWFERPDDPFERSPGIISYDWTNRRQVAEDQRAWIAGLGDEGGSGSWLAAAAKQLLRPERSEIEKLERFIDETLWGGLQYSTENPGPGDSLAWGVRKSLFWYEPDRVAPGTYSDSIRYGGWASWNREHAMSVGRSFNYVHVAAAYWTLYRVATAAPGLVTRHSAAWYLDQARQTALAMMRHAPYYAQFGQMGGTVFVRILEDLRRNGRSDEADAYESVMRSRADVWQALPYPFGSEMPWDSTGQEEVYAWCRHFGLDEKAAVTLGAILGYMPTVPHWGYNGSARRYWDFQYAGHPATAGVERQLHHYGSGLNALPVLTEFRREPDDLYLLRVGYAGLLGAIANVTREGYGPSAFHAFPARLHIDGYSGDYGPNFLGHVLNSAAYVVHDAELGWLGFGANLERDGASLRIRPIDAGRSRLFIAPIGLWIELEAGRIAETVLDLEAGRVTVVLAPASAESDRALLRITGAYAPAPPVEMRLGAYDLRIGSDPTSVVLLPTP